MSASPMSRGGDFRFVNRDRGDGVAPLVPVLEYAWEPLGLRKATLSEASSALAPRAAGGEKWSCPNDTCQSLGAPPQVPPAGGIPRRERCRRVGARAAFRGMPTQARAMVAIHQGQIIIIVALEKGRVQRRDASFPRRGAPLPPKRETRSSRGFVSPDPGTHPNV
jgi:hypothetical protein